MYTRAEIKEIPTEDSKHYTELIIFARKEPRNNGFNEIKFSIQEKSTTQSKGFSFEADGTFMKRGKHVSNYKITDKSGNKFEPEYEQICDWFDWFYKF